MSDEATNQVAKQLIMSETQRYKIHPLLLGQRFIVKDETMYVLHPLPQTYCSNHVKMVRSERNVNNVLMHLCGKDHFDRIKLLPNGQEVIDKWKVIEICELCKTIPKCMAAHLKNHHNVEPYRRWHFQDLSHIEIHTVWEGEVIRAKPPKVEPSVVAASEAEPLNLSI